MPNRLYTISLALTMPVSLLAQAGDTAWRWHARYRHLPFHGLHDLTIKNMVAGMPAIDRMEQFYEGCTLGKQPRTPFPRATVYRVGEQLELAHGDLCGPITPVTAAGNMYFLLIVDDAFRYMWVEMLRSKDEALTFFKKVKALAENELGRRMKPFRTDRGGGFNSNDFAEFCNKQGLRRHITMSYSPQ